MNRFRTIAMAAIAGFVLVACGPAASGNQSPGGAASQPASQAAQASGGGGPSFGEGVVADLEALIPDTVGDLTMTKSSSKGSDYLTGSGSSPEMIQFLNEVGVAPSDVSLAIGSASSAASSADPGAVVFMFVIRAKGADSSRLVAAYKSASAAGDASPIQWASANIAGKSVETGGATGATNYLYPKNDVLFWFIASTPALAEQLISQLP